jgi:choline dehydrogenase-like flavoprotein
MLTATNVPVKVDAPGVGSNFQRPASSLQEIAQYAATREGPKSFRRDIAAAFLTFKQFSSSYLCIANQIQQQSLAKYLPATYSKNPTLLAGYKKQREILRKAYLGDATAIGEIPIQAWGHNTLAYQKLLSCGTITLNPTNTEDIIQQPIEQDLLNPTFSYPTCSCPMMPLALGGVVGDQLLVYGVKQLSIIDASIIPLIPATHLQAMMYAIAVKAAGLI